MRIQDVRELEERIADAVNEYLYYPDGYTNAVLRVYLDTDEMMHRAEVDDADKFKMDDEVYPIDSVIRYEDGIYEPDMDKISKIANSWIFVR